MVHITYVILEYPKLSSQNRTKITMHWFIEGRFSVLFCWLTFLFRFSLIPLTQIKPNVAVVILSWSSYIFVSASSAISSNDTVLLNIDISLIMQCKSRYSQIMIASAWEWVVQQIFSVLLLNRSLSRRVLNMQIIHIKIIFKSSTQSPWNKI